MTLHLVFSSNGWQACQLRRQEADAVVLLGDGVYAAHQSDSAGVHVLTEDAHIRGVSTGAATTSISYEELVVLCTEYQPVVSWND